MENQNNSNPYSKIEYYLYNYNLIESKIEELESIKATSEYNQNYTKWIKNKSSSLEDQVIRNINKEKRICKLKKWKALLSFVIEHYKNSDNLKYKYIQYKYFECLNSSEIESKLNIDKYKQKDIKAEILHYIFLICIKKNMLKEVN